MARQGQPSESVGTRFVILFADCTYPSRETSDLLQNMSTAAVTCSGVGVGIVVNEKEWGRTSHLDHLIDQPRAGLSAS